MAHWHETECPPNFIVHPASAVADAAELINARRVVCSATAAPATPKEGATVEGVAKAATFILISAVSQIYVTRKIRSNDVN